MAQAEGTAAPRTPVPHALVGWGIAGVLLGAGGLLYLLGQRLAVGRGWLYVGLLAAAVLVNLVCLLRWNRELIARRMRLGNGTKTWDKVWSVLFAPVMIAIYVVAGLDPGAATGPPGLAWLLGIAIFVPGSALLIGSMTINPFFEKTVRIQTDRGQYVVDTGPYAVVRHPGYVGFLGWVLSAPLLLGSAWAWLPALLATAGVVVRTALEDRTLQAELPGYREYAARVRHRLLPGVW